MSRRVLGHSTIVITVTHYEGTSNAGGTNADVALQAAGPIEGNRALVPQVLRSLLATMDTPHENTLPGLILKAD